MADEFIRPSADTTLDGWTDNTNGTTTIYVALDESSANDADFVQSPIIDASQADLHVRLYQGSTEIAEWTHSDVTETFATAEQTLTAPQLAAISDFNDLFIELDDNSGSVYRFALGNPAGPLLTPVVVRYRYKRAPGFEEEVIDPANLLTYPEDMSGWSPTGVTVTTDDTTNPNGVATADRVTVDAASGFSGGYQGYEYASASYRLTCRFKRINWDFICLAFYNGDGGATFDLNLGTVTFESSECTGTGIIVPLADGWYRCSVEITLGFGAFVQYPEFYFSGVGTSMNRPRNSGSPTSSDAVHVWGIEMVTV